MYNYFDKFGHLVNGSNLKLTVAVLKWFTRKGSFLKILKPTGREGKIMILIRLTRLGLNIAIAKLLSCFNK